MKINTAKRMNSFSSSIFSEIASYKANLINQGKEIIDLSIGSPDLPPPAMVKETISNLSMEDKMYGYSLAGTDAFHRAVNTYYKREHGFEFNTESEILQLMGSQDGLVHLPMTVANPDDIILVPDPGYTAYATGIAMAGATPYFMPLLKENGFLPDFTKIPAKIAKKAVMMILNFPGNPIPVMATKELFEKAISFALENNIIIVHDFAYSELYYGDRKPLSFLSMPNSKKVGIEMNSLSKSYNMAGSRVAFACGNKEIIHSLKNLKSNLDYGVFLPVQVAASVALIEGKAFSESTRAIYKERRDILVQGLNELGWEIPVPEAGMFIWAEIPKQYNTKEFVYLLMEKAGVAVTPGSAFGPSGEGFIRIALVQDKKVLATAIENIEQSRIIK